MAVTRPLISCFISGGSEFRKKWLPENASAIRGLVVDEEYVFILFSYAGAVRLWRLNADLSPGAEDDFTWGSVPNVVVSPTYVNYATMWLWHNELVIGVSQEIYPTANFNNRILVYNRNLELVRESSFDEADEHTSFLIE